VSAGAAGQSKCKRSGVDLPQAVAQRVKEKNNDRNPFRIHGLLCYSQSVCSNATKRQTTVDRLLAAITQLEYENLPVSTFTMKEVSGLDSWFKERWSKGRHCYRLLIEEQCSTLPLLSTLKAQCANVLSACHINVGRRLVVLESGI
jgi:hypothetical protein